MRDALKEAVAMERRRAGLFAGEEGGADLGGSGAAKRVPGRSAVRSRDGKEAVRSCSAPSLWGAHGPARGQPELTAATLKDI